MIQSFRHKGLQRLFDRNDGRRLPPQDVDKLRRILARLEVASVPEDMDAPGFRLHALKGELRGFWARDGECELACDLPLRGGRRKRRRFPRLPLRRQAS